MAAEADGYVAEKPATAGHQSSADVPLLPTGKAQWRSAARKAGALAPAPSSFSSRLREGASPGISLGGVVPVKW